MSEFFRRIVLPISLPVAALGFIALLVFFASRILLAVPEVWSTSIALALSATVLFFASVLSALRSVNAAQRLLSIMVGLSVIAAGGVALSQGTRTIEAHSDDVEIAALGIKFDKDLLEFPADEAVKLAFTNSDAGIPHNVSIYPDETSPEGLFVGEIFSGVATKTYEIDPIAAGTYFFKCDVHPDMKGSVEVAEEGAK